MKLLAVFFSYSLFCFSFVYADFDSDYKRALELREESKEIEAAKLMSAYVASEYLAAKLYEDITLNRALEYVKIGNYDRAKFLLQPMIYSSLKVKKLYTRLFPKKEFKQLKGGVNQTSPKVQTFDEEATEVEEKQQSTFNTEFNYNYRRAQDGNHHFTMATLPLNLDLYDDVYKHRYIKTQLYYFHDGIENDSGNVKLASMYESISAVIGVELENYSIEVGITPTGFKIKPALTTKLSAYLQGEALNMKASIVRRSMDDSLLSFVGLRKGLDDDIKDWGRILKGGLELELEYESLLDYNLDIALYPYIEGANIEDNSQIRAGASVFFTTKRDKLTDVRFGLEGVYDAYERNSNSFNYGHGGYFSPQNYLLGNFRVDILRRYNSHNYWELKTKFGYEKIEVDDTEYAYAYQDLLAYEKAYTKSRFAYDLSYSTGFRFNENLDLILDASFKSVYSYYDTALGFTFVYYFGKENREDIYDFHTKRY